jgi:mannose-6-phosphate isomerase-like protein (cupin superfamily)
VNSDFWLRKIISPELGAEFQSQFYLEQSEGGSPILTAGDTHVILFVATGHGEAEISGRIFPIRDGDGVYVRPGEAFRLTAEVPLRVFVSALPSVEALEQLASMPANFDAAEPERVRGVDQDQRTEMGPRYFQMLVDKSVGSRDAAQFIGHIPPSRAEMHRHLYEEALIILSGEGIIWNEESCAPVGAGDVIFLPRKHGHSLECVAAEGMDVVGVIHPGDNPGINY